MNKLIIILLVVFYSMINASIALAEEESLGQYLYKNPGWANEKSSLAFIGTRCAVIYTISLERLKLNPNKKTEALISRLNSAGNVFATSVLATSAELGVSEENMLARTKFWSETYMEYSKKDWVKYNNIYQGFVGEDLKTCSSAYPVFEKLIVKYGEQFK
jgi:hypothetical protein